MLAPRSLALRKSSAHQLRQLGDVGGDDLSGAGKGGRGKVVESAKFPVHPETLSKARAVLTFSRPLAKAVRDGSWASEG
jgi:hypothetical protein